MFSIKTQNIKSRSGRNSKSIHYQPCDSSVQPLPVAPFTFKCNAIFNLNSKKILIESPPISYQFSNTAQELCQQ